MIHRELHTVATPANGKERKPLTRRMLIQGLVPTLFFAVNARYSETYAQNDLNFEEVLKLAAREEAALEAVRGLNEHDFRQIGPSLEALRDNRQLPRRWTSEKPISKRARDMIILFEVTSQATYNRMYRAPTWPRGASGLTIGIGYDLGYVSPKDFSEDWDSFLNEETLANLTEACQKKGVAARSVLPRFADVRIDWETANEQFRRILRFYAGEVVQYFRNADELSPDSFGALVSLVYNRGSSSNSPDNDPIDRRREMREIKRLMFQREFDRIPGEISKMKRIWKDQPDARGLLIRRDLEADLFKTGLL